MAYSAVDMHDLSSPHHAESPRKPGQEIDQYRWNDQYQAWQPQTVSGSPLGHKIATYLDPGTIGFDVLYSSDVKVISDDIIDACIDLSSFEPFGDAAGRGIPQQRFAPAFGPGHTEASLHELKLAAETLPTPEDSASDASNSPTPAEPPKFALHLLGADLSARKRVPWTEKQIQELEALLQEDDEADGDDDMQIPRDRSKSVDDASTSEPGQKHVTGPFVELSQPTEFVIQSSPSGIFQGSSNSLEATSRDMPMTLRTGRCTKKRNHDAYSGILPTELKNAEMRPAEIGTPDYRDDGNDEVQLISTPNSDDSLDLLALRQSKRQRNEVELPAPGPMINDSPRKGVPSETVDTQEVPDEQKSTSGRSDVTVIGNHQYSDAYDDNGFAIRRDSAGNLLASPTHSGFFGDSPESKVLNTLPLGYDSLLSMPKLPEQLIETDLDRDPFQLFEPIAQGSRKGGSRSKAKPLTNSWQSSASALSLIEAVPAENEPDDADLLPASVESVLLPAGWVDRQEPLRTMTVTNKDMQQYGSEVCNNLVGMQVEERKQRYRVAIVQSMEHGYMLWRDGGFLEAWRVGRAGIAADIALQESFTEDLARAGLEIDVLEGVPEEDSYAYEYDSDDASRALELWHPLDEPSAAYAGWDREWADISG